MKSRGLPERTLEGVPKDTLSNLHKNTQEGAFEVALKGALEVAFGLHLRSHFLIRSLIYKFVQNGSFNGGPDAAIEGALDDGPNVALKGYKCN